MVESAGDVLAPINGGISGVSNSGGFTGTSGGIGGGISGGRVGGISGNLAAGAQGGYVDSGSEIRSRKQERHQLQYQRFGVWGDAGRRSSWQRLVIYFALRRFSQLMSNTLLRRTVRAEGAAQVLGGGIGGY